MDIEKLKYEFLFEMFFIMSFQSAVSTRNPNYPVYRRDSEPNSGIREALKQLLGDYIGRFKAGAITESDHIAEINKVCAEISAKFGGNLHNGRFRFGTAQKLLNLMLKYLWCANEIPEPLHCPIDNIIRNSLLIGSQSILTNWTVMDNANQYNLYIQEIKRKLGPNGSIARWELKQYADKRSRD